MSSNVIPGQQAQLAQRQVDLGDLSLFERHVVAFEVGAAVGLRRIQKQPIEVVRQIVMRLHILETRSEVGHDASAFRVAPMLRRDCYAEARRFLDVYLASVNWLTSM
jgi:hypothetical protein